MEKRFATRIYPILAVPLLIGFTARKAHAQQWGVANVYYGGELGCATAIVVGATNLPAIIGCGDSTIFYDNPTVGGCFEPTPVGCTSSGNAWTAINSPPIAHIAMDLSGEVIGSDNSGNLFLDATPAPPNSNELSQGVVKLSTTSIFGGACVQSFVFSYVLGTPTNPVVFDTPGVNTGLIQNFWGVGCGATPNTVWSLAPNIETADFLVQGSKEWQPVGPLGIGSASQIAIFTDINVDSPGSITQNVWTMAGGGNVYSMNQEGNGFNIVTPPPYPVTSITDHYVVAGGNVYYWNGHADGGGNATWSYVIGPTPNANAPINQIAWSQAIPGTVNGTIGPSSLWAIDTQGVIYELGTPSTPPR